MDHRQVKLETNRRAKISNLIISTIGFSGAKIDTSLLIPSHRYCPLMLMKAIVFIQFKFVLFQISPRNIQLLKGDVDLRSKVDVPGWSGQFTLDRQFPAAL
jgi:hypothetical protein